MARLLLADHAGMARIDGRRIRDSGRSEMRGDVAKRVTAFPRGGSEFVGAGVVIVA